MSKWDDGTLPGSEQGVVPNWLASPQVATARPPSANGTPFARAMSDQLPPSRVEPVRSQASRASRDGAPIGTVGQSWSIGGLAGPVAVPGTLPGDVRVPGQGPFVDRPGMAHHVADAGRAGALSASNAAAETRGIPARRSSERPPPGSGVEPFQLIWVDAPRLGGLRLAQDDASLSDDESWLRCDDFTPDDGEDGRVKASRLLSGAVRESGALEALLFESADECGVVARTHALVRGDLSLLVDARERLRRLCQAVEPHMAIDRRLVEAATQAKEVSGREVATVEAVRHATQRLIDVSATVGRPILDLEAAVDGALLAERKLERRALLGGEVALATFSDGGAQLRCYVPAVALAELPPRRQLAVRLLVEVVPQQEDDDPNEIALAVVAVGRRLRRAGPSSYPPARQTRT